MLNYLQCIETFKYPNPNASHSPGLLSFVSDQEDLDESAIVAKYGKYTRDKVLSFLKGLSKQEQSLNSSQFAIPIKYKLVLTKDEREGDLKLAASKSGNAAVLIEVPKDHNRTHPYRQKDVIEFVNNNLKGDGLKQQFTSYSFQGMLKAEKIRTSPENQFYHRINNPLNHTYSHKLVEMLIHKTTANDSYVDKCKEIWSKHLRGQRTKKNAT